MRMILSTRPGAGLATIMQEAHDLNKKIRSSTGSSIKWVRTAIQESDRHTRTESCTARFTNNTRSTEAAATSDNISPISIISAEMNSKEPERDQGNMLQRLCDIRTVAQTSASKKLSRHFRKHLEGQEMHLDSRSLHRCPRIFQWLRNMRSDLTGKKFSTSPCLCATPKHQSSEKPTVHFGRPGNSKGDNIARTATNAPRRLECRHRVRDPISRLKFLFQRAFIHSFHSI